MEKLRKDDEKKKAEVEEEEKEKKRIGEAKIVESFSRFCVCHVVIVSRHVLFKLTGFKIFFLRMLL